LIKGGIFVTKKLKQEVKELVNGPFVACGGHRRE